MALIPNDLIEKARNVDFKNFLERKEGWHFKKAGKFYKCIEHDSFMLNWKGNILLYSWYSKCEKGDIITFTEKNIVQGSFRKAVEYILKTESSFYSIYKNEYESFKNQEPDKNKSVQIELNPDMRRTFGYLIKARGINSKIVKEFVEKGKVVEDRSNNVVFKYLDEKGSLVGGEVKGTYSLKKYGGMIKNTNESYGFTMEVGANYKKLYVFEASIDLISFYELFRDKIKDSILLSQGGCSKINKISTYLMQYKDINDVIVCFDNDDAGDNYYNAIIEKYSSYKIYDGRKLLIKYGVKDFNDLLKKGYKK